MDRVLYGLPDTYLSMVLRHLENALKYSMHIPMLQVLQQPQRCSSNIRGPTSNLNSF